MIYIQERESVKAPGVTSLFLSFVYNPRIVEALQDITCKIYNKKLHEWEIPLNYFAHIINKLCVIDDITITLLPDNAPATNLPLLSNNYKLQPLPHQLEGIRYGLTHDKWLLLDPPGLGKTLQAILLAQELYEQRGLKHCLIVCGINNLKWNWVKEIQKTTYLDATILGQKTLKNGRVTIGTVKERLEHIYSGIKEFFIITNIETLRNDEIIKALKENIDNTEMIVIDEVHTIKDPRSQQATNLLTLKDFQYKVAMTGTLILNSPLDLYVPLKWLGIEKSSFSVFKSNYCIFDKLIRGMIKGYKNLNMLKHTLEQYSIRRELELPIMQIIPEYVEMNSQQASFYSNIEKGIVDQIDKVKLPDNATLLSLITRLRQASSTPEILTSEPIKSSKIERALLLAQEILSNNCKVVIFSTFKEPVYQLAELLKDQGCVIGTGDEKDEVISENIDKFQTDPNTKVFIGTWQKCGTGITLTAASYMIFLDTPWTYAVFDQACKRIHRIGTEKPTFIYNIICKDTIDEKVYEILNRKKALSEFIIDDKLDENALNSLKSYILDLTPQKFF